MNLLHNIWAGIAKALVIPLVFVLSSAGYTAPTPTGTPSFGAFSVSGGGTYRLRTTAASSDTSIQLSSFKEPISNIPYTMAYLGSSIGFGTLDPQQPTRSEFISFTGITQNSDGTAVLTGVTRGVPRTPGATSNGSCSTASTTLQQAHAGQSIFILSDSPCFFNQFAVKQNNELIPGAWIASSTNPFSYDNLFNITSTSTSKTIQTASWVYSNFIRSNESTTVNATTTFSATGGLVITNQPTNATDAVNKSYADGLAAAGCANGSTSVKGCFQEATLADLAAATAVGSTGARLTVNPSTLAPYILTTGIVTYSTTTLGNMATMTVPFGSVPDKQNIRIKLYSPGTSGNTVATTTAAVVIGFNQFIDAAQTTITALRWSSATNTFLADATNENRQVNQFTTTQNVNTGVASGFRPIKQVDVHIDNGTTTPKWGEFVGWAYGTSTNVLSGTNAGAGLVRGNFEWSTTTTRIKSIDIWYSQAGAFFATGTQVIIEGY